MNKSLIAGALCVLASLATPVLAAGDAEAGKTKSAVCAACHGADGKAIMADYPNLAGQGADYIVKQLRDFKEGRRENVLMTPMAMPLSDEDMLDLAAYFSSLPAIEGVAAEENLQLGMDIYRGGITSAEIPACIGCHGPDGSGNPPAGYPALHGQNGAYAVLQLQAFRSGERDNDLNQMMRSVAHRMTDAEIQAVANYLQGLH
ncbi:c-type cytochrome [Granulosicoccaceae sp. 1_MG-2023]|nr:c-type cytochrome [Granulosicoccaceae sp. 1_MG-2023]